MPASRLSRVWMAAAMAVGLAYVAWLAWAEGWRLWVVMGVMALVGAIGGAVHLAMGLARQREGLDATGSGSAAAGPPSERGPEEDLEQRPEEGRAASDPGDPT